MNPRSLLAHHLPTLTEVVDESAIATRPSGPIVDLAMEHTAPDLAPVIDLSDAVQTTWRTPTPQEVDRLRGDDAPFEATISDHQIRRALAEAEAIGRGADADPVDLSLADAAHGGEPAIDEALLADRVVADVQRKVDALLEYRLREALAPLLAQVADTLAVEARDVLASSLRDLVSQAVAHEIERQRGR